MKNTIRIIIYAFMLIVCTAGGVYGYLINYNNNKISIDDNTLLTKILSNFNSNERIVYLKEHNNIIETKLDNKTITIKNINPMYTNKYYAKYDNGYIYYNFDKNNSIQNAIFKILVSSVAQLYDKTYDEVIIILDSQNLENFIIENGLSYKANGDEVHAIINTKVPINAYHVENTPSSIEAQSSVME